MIIGSAFTAIVKSLVENIVTPLIGVLLGGLDFSGPELHDRQRCHRDRPVCERRDHLPADCARAVLRGQDNESL